MFLTVVHPASSSSGRVLFLNRPGILCFVNIPFQTELLELTARLQMQPDEAKLRGTSPPCLECRFAKNAVKDGADFFGGVPKSQGW